jgi:hypothetical protein
MIWLNLPTEDRQTRIVLNQFSCTTKKRHSIDYFIEKIVSMKNIPIFATLNKIS